MTIPNNLKIIVKLLIIEKVEIKQALTVAIKMLWLSQYAMTISITTLTSGVVVAFFIVVLRVVMLRVIKLNVVASLSTFWLTRRLEKARSKLARWVVIRN
jgi:hypothetical protein